MNINNFPIPDLPAPMLNDVLKKLGTMDLIHYSTTSESCKSNVKSMLRKRQVKLGISVVRSSLILHHSFPNFDERDCNIQIINTNGKVFFDMTLRGEKQCTRSLSVRWETAIDGLIFWLDYLTELFPHMPICHLETGRPLFEDDYLETKKVIEWIKKRDKPEVENCRLYCPMTAEHVPYVLDNVTITSVLEIFKRLPDDFKLNLPQNLELLDCADALWISRDQLLRMNYKQIYLKRTKLQNKDISDLMNKIINGDLPALKFCKIVINLPNINEIVSGVNYDKLPSQLKHYQYPLKYGREIFDIYGVYDYERADGKIVSICSEAPNRIGYSLIFVWSRTEPLEPVN